MVRRSVLFSPGDRPEMLRKALSAGADVVVFDLEDAVAPARKETAREAVREVLTDPEIDPDLEVCLRVNPGPASETDLETVLADGAPAHLDAVVLPKVGAAQDVETLAERLAERDAPMPVFALIESARGVLAAAEVAAVPETDALLFGAEDFAADVGASRTPEGTEVLYARQRIVTAAAAHDCTAIDTVYPDFSDDSGLREETARARRFGYDGKLAIHPRQIEPIHEAFTPDPAELEWAERVLEAATEAGERSDGVFEVDGQMIDAPLLTRAERLVERASRDRE